MSGGGGVVRPLPAGGDGPAAWTARHGMPVGGALLAAGGPAVAPARFEALMLDPVEVLEVPRGEGADPFGRLEALADRARGGETPGLCPRVACLLGYDLGRSVEEVPALAAAEGHLPDLWAARYRAAWVHDRATGAGWISAEDDAAAEALAARLLGGGTGEPALRPLGPAVATTSAVEHRAAVARIQAHITAGDVYQINYAIRFEAPVSSGDPAALFARLAARSPVPFAACVRPSADTAVLSLSPERFLAWSADGAVETRPIKGTRPRGADDAADAALAAELRASAKDQAEHVMIVDLQRNDLGRVCAPGTVQVPRLLALESYATVHHLVSTVVGRLEAPHRLADLLRATFPGGSITGAPRLRAMQIIEALEPVRRGIYCGSVGYVDARGGGDLNIAIRTAWVAGGRLYYSAGGGIVADSEAAAEHAEALVKAQAFLDALADA